MTAAKELFIVEGESAASTVTQAMHKATQSVMAVQGKLLNTEKATANKVRANQACQKIFQALACGIGNDCNPDNLAFSRILILTDPDVDGTHARALLLMLFDNYLRALVDAEYVYVIIPPLFRITGNHQKHCHYAWSEQERIAIFDKQAEKNEYMITRFKGVAQFSQEECVRLLLSPGTRKQIKINRQPDPMSTEIA
jgi:DNA gyrase/topoisomerase IV subunit B